MIRSMTGYGSAALETEHVRAAVTVRSLNHRFLELQVHAPRRLQAMEPEIKERVVARLGRGRVEVVLRADALAGTPSQTLLASRPLVAELVRLLRDLQVEQRLDGGVTVSDILRFPGAIEVGERDLEPEGRETLLTLVGQALDALLTMRGAEGRRLLEVLERSLGAIEAAAARIEDLATAGKVARSEALLEKLRALPAELGLAEAALYQEVVRTVERHDVTEEVERLRSHVAMARELLAGEEPSGKRLDFIAQELMREANTVGSKAVTAAIVREVVTLKSEIERLREQVQNVE